MGINMNIGVSHYFKSFLAWIKKCWPLERKAKKGDIEAQLALGKLYLEGEKEGVAVDCKKAEYWLEKAAAVGHAEAQFELGYFYDTAKGGGRDCGKAKHWYLKSAQQGNTKAQCNMAALYLRGDGGFHEGVADFWLESAARAGDALAGYHLKQLRVFVLGSLLREEHEIREVHPLH
jgi:TPR repeat protein